MFTFGDFIAVLLRGDEPAGKKWIEEQDIINHDEKLDRRNAARILHAYMKEEMGMKDMEDITPAYVLKDLFDCRTCANHIAAVYLNGIMDSVKLGELTIFDVYGGFNREDAFEVIRRLELHG